MNEKNPSIYRGTVFLLKNCRVQKNQEINYDNFTHTIQNDNFSIHGHQIWPCQSTPDTHKTHKHGRALELATPSQNVVSEVLVAIFGICAKNAAQRWGRELPKGLLSPFPVETGPKCRKVTLNRVFGGSRCHFRLLCEKCCTTVGSRGPETPVWPVFGRARAPRIRNERIRNERIRSERPVCIP